MNITILHCLRGSDGDLETETVAKVNVVNMEWDDESPLTSDQSYITMYGDQDTETGEMYYFVLDQNLIDQIVQLERTTK